MTHDGDIFWRDDGSPQVCLPLGDDASVIIVSDEAGKRHAYLNRCPHLGISLDYGDGSCLTDDGLLICATHGALFRRQDGYCIQGPCGGRSLQRLELTVEGDTIRVRVPQEG